MSLATRLARCTVLLCLVAPVALTPTTAAADPGTVLWLSDIHFNPFYTVRTSDADAVRQLLESLVDRSGPQPRWRPVDEWDALFAADPVQAGEFNTRNTDTNYKLLSRLLDRAAAVAPDPDFILITGDFLGHGFGSDFAEYAPDDLKGEPEAYRGFVLHTLAFLADAVRDRYPVDAAGDAPPVYANLGNNDAYCGDYDIHLDSGDSDFLADTRDVWLRYYLVGLSAAEKRAFESSFLDGGYYAVTPRRAPGNRLIMLNSIPFMAKYPSDFRGDSFPDTEASCAAQPVIDAAAQLAWLDGELPTASGAHAWIAAHVPPGEDCYGARHGGDAQYWTAAHTATLRGQILAQDHRAGVAGLLAAHSHDAEFKVIRDGTSAASFVLMAPSVSPNHGNNPSFRVLHHDRGDLSIRSYDTHYKALYACAAEDCEPQGTCWEHVSYAHGYGQPAVDAASLDAVFGALESGVAGTVSEYLRDYNTRACGGSIKTSWASFPGCIGSLGGAFTTPQD